MESSADGHGRHPEVKAVQQTRRLLANARERTRVHTISAAFEALRKQVRLTLRLCHDWVDAGGGDYGSETGVQWSQSHLQWVCRDFNHQPTDQYQTVDGLVFWALTGCDVLCFIH